MKAPDKLYLSKDLFRWNFNEPTDKTDICYIRKEALLDWLKKKQKGEGKYWLYDELIDKLNSM